MFSEEKYNQQIEEIFQRFPSVQNVPFKDAYKPGLEHMRDFAHILGDPQNKIRTVHIAGTNGKGSTANMLAASFFASGYKTGLYTSPHISDFRERIRVNGQMISKAAVSAFLDRYRGDFESLSLSFFEITTGLALKYFADSHVDIAIIETGLGGRLDSTNIITPVLSVITSIGLDHCDLLGNSLAAIAAEKAGIIKEGVPVVIGEMNSETAPVFEKKASETSSFLVHADVTEQPAVCKNAIADNAIFVQADVLERTVCDAKRVCESELEGDDNKVCESQIEGDEQTVSENAIADDGRREEKRVDPKQLDLRGAYQRKNLRTAEACIKILRRSFPRLTSEGIADAAKLMDFHGRWEQLSDKPLTICDIGHNAHALRNNFAQLEAMLQSGEASSLTIVYGIMADKDLSAILPLLPRKATYVFASPPTSRALDASIIHAEVAAYRGSDEDLYTCESVEQAVVKAKEIAAKDSARPMIYIGGSTFVVARAVKLY